VAGGLGFAVAVLVKDDLLLKGKCAECHGDVVRVIVGTQATLADVFDEQAGFKVSNADDVEAVSNYRRAFRWTQAQLRDSRGLPVSVRLWCEALAGKRASCGARKTGSVAPGPATRSSFPRRRRTFPDCWPICSASFTTARRICRRGSRWRSSMRSLKPSTPFATAAVRGLEAMGIVRAVTGLKKNRTCSYQSCVDLLSR
jgi:hypothetical protein